MIYGGAPTDLGIIEVEPSEMMFVQYMPVKFPMSPFQLPENLVFADKLLSAVIKNIGEKYDDHYFYLTVKSLYVDRASRGRPCWHSDGFGTDDLNFIWYDSDPTDFCVQEFNLSNDCDLSLQQMQDQAKPENIIHYPCKSLLKMDQSVIHRVSEIERSGYRTFIKISVSKDQYNLKGNAHNYLFDYKWEMLDREEKRNHPSKNNTN